MTRGEDEAHLEGVVANALRRWLGRARAVVMAPWRQFKMQPDPTAIYSSQTQWNDEVETILTTIGQIAMDAWNEVEDAPPVSRNAFTFALLADVENLLVRIPGEIADLAFAEITDGINAGENQEQIANRIDRVLDYTASERWPGRARTITRTEVTRARAAGVQGAGAEMARVTGRVLRKTWRTSHDERVRIPHRDADGQTVSFYMPFQVGGEMLMFPGDPTGSPENVINCRCDLVLVNEVRP